MVSDWSYDPRDSRGADANHGEFGVFTVTNFTSGLSLDCNANNDLLTADTLATLIKILIQKGIIGGTVA
jgi:hypothetical protein